MVRGEKERREREGPGKKNGGRCSPQKSIRYGGTQGGGSKVRYVPLVLALFVQG